MRIDAVLLLLVGLDPSYGRNLYCVQAILGVAGSVFPIRLKNKEQDVVVKAAYMAPFCLRNPCKASNKLKYPS